MKQYIIAWSVVAVVALGFFFLMKEASEFDHRFVNRCKEAGGTAHSVGAVFQCVKDGKMIIVE